MAQNIAIMGESGSGKTTSMRNLPPEETLYIDSDSKGLSWRGWRKQYSTDNKNYIRTSNQRTIMKMLEEVNNSERFKHIKYVVIDTMNGIMVDDEMRRMREKSYDKWADLAFAVYGIILYQLNMRDDLTCIDLFHTQVERDDSGNVWTRIKTSGKKLDKIVLESKFTTVLHARCLDGKYIFETQSNNSTAKSPMGAFSTPTIDNDIMNVINALEEFK